MFDIDACAVAMDVTSSEHLCSIAGTWSINEYISDEPKLNTAVAMNSLFAIPGKYLIEDSSPTGAGNLEWVLNNLLANEPLAPGQKLYHKADELVASCSPDTDVYFLPFLYGSNAHPLARACFIGLSSFHDRAHMLRAVYEGAVFTAKRHIDKLLSTRESPQAIRLAGGAANAPIWVQMFADILGFPIETVSGVKELGAMGCAMAAFVAAGVYADYVQAAKAMVKVAPPILPRREMRELYARKYELYSAITGALDGVWDKFEVG
jgi:L-xylulokinase